MAQAELITKFAAATEDTTPVGDADYLLTLDATGPSLKKVKPNNLSVGKVRFGTVASAGATGVQGEIRFNATHVFFCVATDTWVRASIATW